MRPSPEQRIADAFCEIIDRSSDDDIASLKAEFDKAEQAHDAWREATSAYNAQYEQYMKIRKALRRELHLLDSYLAIWALEGFAQVLALAGIEGETGD